MVIVILLILFKPEQYMTLKNQQLTITKTIILVFCFLIVGFYGGFIQAGVGFLIIAFLSIFASKLMLVEMHSIKTVVTTIYLLISTIIFIAHGQVNWLYAVSLAVGSGIGGWLGSRFAIKVSEKFLKITTAIVIFLMAGKLLFF
ncbi:sulfite exporter TauE/SafE family protein [Virgibacillus sp. 179-BFC.A HS]|uniref:Probable membrane transporter protein n=1 Tax=Tigheibacillus jepli TaxID=3035914 RepID=A0ABU5CF74_9BACI|nr:sulfite exporter TauE/SafE family protein [Virgibacillus sp. 179-BFC.A HS]MDY0404170.1 sulfite exporter TauE/SafE family protein [Virgibacillus sp. 179-BFC.A HS]